VTSKGQRIRGRAPASEGRPSLLKVTKYKRHLVEYFNHTVFPVHAQFPSRPHDIRGGQGSRAARPSALCRRAKLLNDVDRLEGELLASQAAIAGSANDNFGNRPQLVTTNGAVGAMLIGGALIAGIVGAAGLLERQV
jgi:hypothetical protein